MNLKKLLLIPLCAVLVSSTLVNDVKADTMEDIIKEIDELTSRSVDGSYAMSKDGKSVKIYETASKSSEVIGLMTKKSAVIIDPSYYDEKWIKITANDESITGYILASKVVTGDAVLDRCKELNMKKTVVVDTTEIDVRKDKDITSEVIMVAKENEAYELIKEFDDVVQVKIDENLEGYITKDFVKNSYNFNDVRDLVAEKLEAERQKALEAARAAALANFTSNITNNSVIDTSSLQIKKNSLVSDDIYNLSDLQNASAQRQAFVKYALQFVGNKYVYGGTDLYNGIDCSAYVQQMYGKFGFTLPRVSKDQRSAGTKIKESELLPGDLVCYYGHVAIYIGNGKIVHASNSSPYPKGGIKISNNYNYRTVASCRRFFSE